MNDRKTPAPGSDAARELGCTCPVMDNCRGKGYMGGAGVFVRRADCPIHGERVRKLRDAEPTPEAKDK